MSELDFLIRLVVAFGLGLGIGLERQWRQRMAGLQTNTLVATGAALFVMLSVMVSDRDSSPTRVTAQIVSGIGFLGGGVILREGVTIRGLNTAATLWCAGAIGALSGWGLFFQSTIGAIAVISANLLLYPLRYRINRQPLRGTELELGYSCQIICCRENEIHLRTLLLKLVSSSNTMQLRSLLSESIPDNPDRHSIKAQLITQKRDHAFLEKIVSRLSLESGVFSASWQIIEQESP
ncbi:MgtC/SapB family protein [Cyanothece sp. BG0011]|uniref:MgtC/SapB family protein n=1 Tax=Cyanothece sp. BG0011 TaxID=2082950 RepID=UPI000D1E478C|nr:MgtC/SapB family protein [Cyanothece sp. BG0011]